MYRNEKADMSSDSDDNDDNFAKHGTILNDESTLPEKSERKYNAIYRAFMNWRESKNIIELDENVLLNYFKHLSQNYKSSSLWTIYSMLRKTLKINHCINMEQYEKLRIFLREISKGQHSKKTKLFTSDEINRFVIEAPDDNYLVAKVLNKNKNFMTMIYIIINFSKGSCYIQHVGIMSSN